MSRHETVASGQLPVASKSKRRRFYLTDEEAIALRIIRRLKGEDRASHDYRLAHVLANLQRHRGIGLRALLTRLNQHAVPPFLEWELREILETAEREGTVRHGERYGWCRA